MMQFGFSSRENDPHKVDNKNKKQTTLILTDEIDNDLSLIAHGRGGSKSAGSDKSAIVRECIFNMVTIIEALETVDPRMIRLFLDDAVKEYKAKQKNGKNGTQKSE